jgi:hypothetical protein
VFLFVQEQLDAGSVFVLVVGVTGLGVTPEIAGPTVPIAEPDRLVFFGKRETPHDPTGLAGDGYMDAAGRITIDDLGHAGRFFQSNAAVGLFTLYMRTYDHPLIVPDRAHGTDCLVRSPVFLETLGFDQVEAIVRRIGPGPLQQGVGKRGEQ